MARPLKRGLDYFPLDVNWLLDRKFRKCKVEYGHLAPIIYIELLCILFRDEGYYVKYNSENKDDVIWEIQSSLQGKYQPNTSTIEEVIADLVACGLFDGDRFNDGLITSKRAQRTYYEVTVKRERIELNKSVWLFSEKETELIAKHMGSVYFFVSEELNGVSEELTIINSAINSQSKEKESKVKQSESKVENMRSAAQNTAPTQKLYGTYKNVLLSDEDIDALISEFPTSWSKYIERLSEYMASTGKAYKNHLATIRSWAKKDTNTSKNTKKSKFCNYNDTNKPDYSNFSEQILKDMLGEYEKKQEKKQEEK